MEGDGTTDEVCVGDGTTDEVCVDEGGDGTTDEVCVDDGLIVCRISSILVFID